MPDLQTVSHINKKSHILGTALLLSVVAMGITGASSTEKSPIIGVSAAVSSGSSIGSAGEVRSSPQQLVIAQVQTQPTPRPKRP